MNPEIRRSAVIVAFRNTSGVLNLLDDLIRQTCPLSGIFLISNSPDPGLEKKAKQKIPSLRYFEMPENIGSAGGYFEGMKRAMEESDYIWLLDDDVRVETDTLQILSQAFLKTDQSGKTAAVRCGWKDPWDSPLKEMDIFSWRGTLIKVSALREVGLPLKEYFLYGEDLELSLRLRRLGYVFFWAVGSRMTDTRTNREFSGENLDFYTEPYRLYYAFRNEINAVLRHLCCGRLMRVLGYAIRLSLYLSFERAKIADRREKLRAVREGIIDGIFFRLGRNDRYLPPEGT